MSPRDIRGGIGYRYAGFYGSLIKTVLKNSKAEVFWYSHSDQKLIVISSGKVSIKKKTMLEAILSAILTTLKKQKRLIVIIAFPYAAHPPPVTFGYLFSLMILSLVKIFVPNKIKVIIDDIDPPVEALYAFSEKEPPVLSVIFNRGIELLTLKLSSIILVHTMSFKLYLAKIYRLRKDKIWIVPCGALVQYIRYVPPKAKGPITILYSGSLMSVKNIDKLISAVEDLRREGLQISLVITGSIVDVIPPKWVTHRYVKDYLTYVKDVLEKADICVIPYPNTKLFWNYTLLTKFVEYMAAGKPVISTKLKEVSKIIKIFNCGLIANNWDEFKECIRTLYYNRNLATELGRNGRQAAENTFNYEVIAKEFLNKLIKILESGEKSEKYR